MNNFKIINISLIEKEKVLFDIMELWNHEVGFIFPFYKDLLLQKTFDCKFFNENSSFLVYKDNMLIGFILCKMYDNNQIMSKYINTAWISLIYVSENYRKKGLGSLILKKSEEELRKQGAQKIMIGADYNNFFPGIPTDFIEVAEPFFCRNGYILENIDYDVIRNIKENYTVNLTRSNELIVKYATKDDKTAVLDFFKKNFYGRWYYEALEYFEEIYEEKTYLVVFDIDKVVGFIRVNKHNSEKVSYNVNWKMLFERLYGFGPLGVDQEYRGKGLARLLIETALNDAVNEGASNIIIDWTSLVKFYEKFGFSIWKSYRHGSKSLINEKE